jgi:hypothetical protein
MAQPYMPQHALYSDSALWCRTQCKQASEQDSLLTHEIISSRRRAAHYYAASRTANIARTGTPVQHHLHNAGAIRMQHKLPAHTHTSECDSWREA